MYQLSVISYQLSKVTTGGTCVYSLWIPNNGYFSVQSFSFAKQSTGKNSLLYRT